MAHCSEIFVGIDVSKARNAIAVADGERGGEVRLSVKWMPRRRACSEW